MPIYGLIGESTCENRKTQCLSRNFSTHTQRDSRNGFKGMGIHSSMA